VLADRVNNLLPEGVHVSADIDAAGLAERDTRFDTALTTEELGVARPALR
jgi:dihydroflavonol-4-reductase